jgi:hydrogenase-4 component E
MSAALLQQVITMAAAFLLLISFALLAQKRLLSVLHWFAMQGVVLAAVTALVGHANDSMELYVSAAVTLALKGVLLPWLLWKIIRKLNVHREVEPLVNIPLTMLIAAAVVVFAFVVALPIEKLSHLLTRNTIAIATANVLLGMLMMITRRKAVTQVVGFLAIENSLFFAAIGATYGMPMVAELGVAFDVLIATIVFGLFFHQIRSTFDSLDLDAMENGR